MNNQVSFLFDELSLSLSLSLFRSLRPHINQGKQATNKQTNKKHKKNRRSYSERRFFVLENLSKT